MRFPIAAILVSLLYTGFSLAGQSLLVERHDVSFGPGVTQAMAIGDFNKDGKPDLVILVNTSNSQFDAPGDLKIALGKGDGTFTPPKTVQVAAGRHLAVADFNMDGIPDIATADTPNRSISVFFGVGDGTFRAPVTSSLLPTLIFGLDSIVAADFNGDGKADLVGTLGSSGTWVLLGNGDGTFSTPKEAVSEQFCCDFTLTTADMNGDGKPDIITNQYIGLSNGDGSFRAVRLSALAGSALEVALGDFNGDGKPDLAFSDPGSPGGVSIWLNRGDATFTSVSAPTLAGFTNPSKLVVMDINGDGKADIVLQSSSPNPIVLLGNGDGTFRSPVALVAGQSSSIWVVASADFDLDGKPDLALLQFSASDISSANVTVLLNRTLWPPVVGGALNGASFGVGAPLVTGAIASIFGNGMAAATTSATTDPLPTKVAGVTVSVNNTPAPIYFVSGKQINIQVPWNALSAGASTGTAQLIVTNAAGAAKPFVIALAAFSPALFTLQSGAGQAIAINADGSLAAASGSVPGFATHPAHAGDALILLGNAFGPVNPPIPTGASSSDALRNTTNTPVVLIGGAPAQLLFSGMSPQFVGVNQLNIVVPAGAPIGDAIPLQIQMGGLTSSSKVTLAIAAQ